MIEETIVPLLLAGELKEIRGKTRFQKLIYIIQRKAQSKNIKGLSFNYEAYLYGPFSSQLASTIDNLVSRNNLNEREDITGGGYTIFVYELTPQGTDTVERVRKGMLIDSELVQTISKVAEEYGPLPLQDLVAAAKSM
jgi:uncharacterized protein YwgA